MANFKISVDIIKSGSPNNLPKEGSASVCNISFAGIKHDTDEISFRKTLFCKDIYNNKTITSFTEPEVDEHTLVDSIELDIPDSPSGLIITYSIYYGSRAIDIIVGEIVKSIIGIGIMAIKAKIPDIPYINIEDKLKKRIDVFEKKLKAKITEEAANQIETISIDKIINASVLLDGNEHIIALTSDIEDEDTSLGEGFNYIEIGDHVANIRLKKQ